MSDSTDNAGDLGSASEGERGEVTAERWSPQSLARWNLCEVPRPSRLSQALSWVPDFLLGAVCALVLQLTVPGWPGTLWLVTIVLSVGLLKTCIALIPSYRAQNRDFLYIRHFGDRKASSIQRWVRTALEPEYGFVALLPPPRSAAEGAAEVAGIRAAPDFTLRTVDSARWKVAVAHLMEVTRGVIIEASPITESLSWEISSASEARGERPLLIVAADPDELSRYPTLRSWYTGVVTGEMGNWADALKEAREALSAGQPVPKIKTDTEVSVAFRGNGMRGLAEFAQDVKRWARETFKLSDPQRAARRRRYRLVRTGQLIGFALLPLIGWQTCELARHAGGTVAVPSLATVEITFQMLLIGGVRSYAARSLHQHQYAERRSKGNP